MAKKNELTKEEEEFKNAVNQEIDINEVEKKLDKKGEKNDN